MSRAEAACLHRLQLQLHVLLCRQLGQLTPHGVLELREIVQQPHARQLVDAAERDRICSVLVCARSTALPTSAISSERPDSAPPILTDASAAVSGP